MKNKRIPLDRFADNQNYVILETHRKNAQERSSFFFSNPLAIVEAFSPIEIPEALDRILRYNREGAWAAGYLAYEAGYAFEPDSFSEVLRRKSHKPLLWFGIYTKPGLPPKPEDIFKRPWTGLPSNGNYLISGIKPSESIGAYSSKIDLIREEIAKGEIYQLNYTFNMELSFSGSTGALYRDLTRSQPTAYSAFINTAHSSIISLSPELFFRKHGNRISVRPMKGTEKRGRDFKEDMELKAGLYKSEKNRAENLMIVDLLRNDLGRISSNGGVHVTKLFDIESYDTITQMTSSIRAGLKPDCSEAAVFRTLFPSGSVTGAPKISAMKLIRRFEKRPRNIYTGAIGYFSPKKSAVFSVAIRTIELNKNKGVMGIGSGIVYDSENISEYNECLEKAKFLTRLENNFQIIETLPATKNGFGSLDLHLERMKASAETFGFVFRKPEILKKLKHLLLRLSKGQRYKVRILLSKNGETDMSVQESPEKNARGPGRIILAGCVMDPSDIFLYHKTTKRRIYAEYAEKAKTGRLTDYVFTNINGEITEGAITNVFILKGKTFFTPPVKAGLLAGITRKQAIQYFSAAEKRLFPDDLIKADRIFVTNSMMGIREVKLADNV